MSRDELYTSVSGIVISTLLSSREWETLLRHSDVVTTVKLITANVHHTQIKHPVISNVKPIIKMLYENNTGR
jgi:hypothetical protein